MRVVRLTLGSRLTIDSEQSSTFIIWTWGIGETVFPSKFESLFESRTKVEISIIVRVVGVDEHALLAFVGSSSRSVKSLSS
jgi:hypothetical protein